MPARKAYWIVGEYEHITRWEGTWRGKGMEGESGEGKRHSRGIFLRIQSVVVWASPSMVGVFMLSYVIGFDSIFCRRCGCQWQPTRRLRSGKISIKRSNDGSIATVQLRHRSDRRACWIRLRKTKVRARTPLEKNVSSPSTRHTETSNKTYL